MYKILFKPIIDKIFSLLLLTILSPLLLLVTLILLVNNKGKAFFSQNRVGKDGEIFKLYKFKSMNDLRGQNGALLEDSLRLTYVGKFIRKTSLDELPQLVNVLKGEMSIIGPRPLLVEYLPLYNEFQKRRHSIKPGITGWAQVNGRNTLSWKDKFDMDIYYIDNVSFNLDLRIILKTIHKVIKSDGINQTENQIMEKFKGN